MQAILENQVSFLQMTKTSLRANWRKHRQLYAVITALLLNSSPITADGNTVSHSGENFIGIRPSVLLLSSKVDFSETKSGGRDANGYYDHLEITMGGVTQKVSYYRPYRGNPYAIVTQDAGVGSGSAHITGTNQRDYTLYFSFSAPLAYHSTKGMAYVSIGYTMLFLPPAYVGKRINMYIRVFHDYGTPYREHIFYIEEMTVEGEAVDAALAQTASQYPTDYKLFIV